MEKGKQMIISGFPGVGKTFWDENYLSLTEDSDSSKFDKADFPQNYIEYIKSIPDHVTKLVSSHKEVRDALVENDMKFILVYPDKSIKEEFIQRYKDRGSSQEFIELVKTNWDTWITELESQTGCEHRVLQTGQYLTDVV